MQKITKAVIPAAGLGTRFLPITKALPKEMLPIIDTPNLEFIVREAVLSGITDILLILAPSKKSVEDYFDVNDGLERRLLESGKTEQAKLIRDVSNLANITYVHQKEPKGLGDAVLCAKNFAAGEPVAVLLGDDLITYDEKPAIGELIDSYYKTDGGTQLGCKYVPDSLLPKYGVVKPMKEAQGSCFQIDDMIEKPKTKELAPSNYAALGRYVLPPEIFSILEHTKPGVGDEIQLTDAIRESMKTNPCYATIFTGHRYDIGSKLGYVEAIVDYALKRDDLRDEVKAYLTEALKKA